MVKSRAGNSRIVLPDEVDNRNERAVKQHRMRDAGKAKYRIDKRGDMIMVNRIEKNVVRIRAVSFFRSGFLSAKSKMMTIAKEIMKKGITGVAIWPVNRLKIRLPLHIFSITAGRLCKYERMRS